MFCTTCGSTVQSMERFCANCGSPCFVSSHHAMKSAMPASIVDDTTRRFDYPVAPWNAEAESPPTATSGESILSKIRRHKVGASLTFVFLLLFVSFALLRSSSRPNQVGVHSDAITSLAVISSSCCGPAPEDLSERISTSVRNSLTLLPEIKIIAANYKAGHYAKEVDPASIGRELGVRALLTVRAVRRGHDDFTVDATLIDTRDRRQIWGQQYQSSPNDLQSVQADISRDITEKLRPRLINAKH